MYKLFAETSPNVFKVALFLEEAGLPWEPIHLDVKCGAQFTPEFRALSPNAKVPVLIDSEPADGGPPWPVWESGAILLYLAEKHGRFLPSTFRARSEAVQWLFWQMAGLGPMFGQHAHFHVFASLVPESEYAKKRYRGEAERLLRVLNARLEGRDFIAGDYSIADMACYPWVRKRDYLDLSLKALPEIQRWSEAIDARVATERAYALIEGLPRSERTLEEYYKTMCVARPDAVPA